MTVPDLKNADEFTVDDWRGAFDALTALYNEAIRRADKNERQLANLESRDVEKMLAAHHNNCMEAIQAIMILYGNTARNRLSRLEREKDELIAEVARLRAAVAVLAAQRPPPPTAEDKPGREKPPTP